MIGANFLDIQEERAKRPFVGHNVTGAESTSLMWSEEFIDERQKEAYPLVYKSLKLYDQITIEMLDATINNDYSEISRLISFWNLLIIKMDRLTMDPISDQLVKNDIYNLWLDVAGDIPYELVDFRPFSAIGQPEVSKYLLSAEYYRKLYVNNWEPIYNDEINNLNAIYSYFFKLVPIMIFLVIILFTYNNINKDKNGGILKLVLTQSIGRGKYYISKWASSALHILTIIFIPPFVMSIIGGFMGRFTSSKYPVFHLNNIFTRLKPIPNYFEQVEKEFITPELLPRVFGHIAPSSVHRSIPPHSDIDIIPFYQYFFIVSILIILFVMFMVAFIQLISAIIDNEIISLVVSVGLVGVFIYLGQHFTQGRAYNFNPFTFSNASRIVEGTLNVTFLTSALIMLISTAVLLAVGYRYFKKKEI